MTLTQLRIFLVVAESGSVRAAAERLTVAQPSVSAAVASLERELAVTLIAREGRGIRLTTAGAALAKSVSESLGLLDSGIRQARAVEAPGSGEVRIAAVTTAAERLLLPLIARFRRLHSAAGVRVEVGNRTSVWEALRRHDADLVVAGRPPPAIPATVLATSENTLLLVRASSTDRRPAKKPLVSDLAARTWLLREEGSGTREATEELLDLLGIRPETMILGSNGAVERGLREGLGVALISRHAVAGPLAEGTLESLACPFTPLERPWHLVCHRDRTLSPTAALLIESMAASGLPGCIVLTAEGGKELARHGLRVAAENLGTARRAR